MYEIEELEAKRDIDRWIDRETKNDDNVPDFWYECDTSDRLAKYLVALGYRKISEGVVEV